MIKTPLDEYWTKADCHQIEVARSRSYDRRDIFCEGGLSSQNISIGVSIYKFYRHTETGLFAAHVPFKKQEISGAHEYASKEID